MRQGVSLQPNKVEMPCGSLTSHNDPLGKMNMHSIFKNFGLWLSFAGIAVLVAWVFQDPVKTGFRFSSSADELYSTLTDLDARAFLYNADILLQRGHLRDWPLLYRAPLNSVFFAAIIKLFGREYFVLKSVLLSAALWALALLAIYHTLSWIRNPLLRFFIINSIWFFEGFRFPTFEIVGPLYSESKTHPLFVLSVCILILGLRKSKWQILVLTPILMGIAAYGRYFYAQLGSVTFIVLMLFPTFRTIFCTCGRGNSLGRQFLIRLKQAFLSNKLLATRVQLKWSFLMFVVFSLVVLPWPLRNLLSFGHWGMCPPSEHDEFTGHWIMPNSGKVIFKAGNTACLVDFQLCQAVNQNLNNSMLNTGHIKTLVIATLIAHPLLWAKHRFKHLIYLWTGSYWKIDNWRNVRLLIEGAVVLGMGIFGLFLLWRYRTFSYQSRFFFYFTIGILFASFLMFCLVHYEFRYSLQLRLFLFFLPFWVLELAKMRQFNRGVNRKFVHGHPV